MAAADSTGPHHGNKQTKKQYSNLLTGSERFLYHFGKQNKTIFEVHKSANKRTIKKNIEKLFKVTVTKVNIINTKTKLKLKQGKPSTKSGYKKAIITLKKGQSIDLTTGI